MIVLRVCSVKAFYLIVVLQMKQNIKKKLLKEAFLLMSKYNYRFTVFQTLEMFLVFSVKLVFDCNSYLSVLIIDSKTIINHGIRANNSINLDV